MHSAKCEGGTKPNESVSGTIPLIIEFAFSTTDLTVRNVSKHKAVTDHSISPNRLIKSPSRRIREENTSTVRGHTIVTELRGIESGH